jgi:hypothetical protein
VGNTSFKDNEVTKSDVLKFRLSRAYKNAGDAGITRLLIVGKIEEANA